MCTAAEFHAEITELYNVNLVAVFISKEHKGAHLLSLIKRDTSMMLEWNIKTQLLVNQGFNFSQFILGQFRKVSKIETKPIRTNIGSCLVSMCAKHFP